MNEMIETRFIEDGNFVCDVCGEKHVGQRGAAAEVALEVLQQAQWRLGWRTLVCGGCVREGSLDERLKARADVLEKQAQDLRALADRVTWPQPEVAARAASLVAVRSALLDADHSLHGLLSLPAEAQTLLIAAAKSLPPPRISKPWMAGPIEDDGPF